jgi:hypothetical protein
MSLFTLELKPVVVLTASKKSTRFLNPPPKLPKDGKIVAASLIHSKKPADTSHSSASNASWDRMMQCSKFSALMNVPMEHRRARVLTHDWAAVPRDLVRLGSSSKARTRAEGEWVDVAMVDRIRKMCLSLAEWTFFRIASRSEVPGDDLLSGTGAEREATSS